MKTPSHSPTRLFTICALSLCPALAHADIHVPWNATDATANIQAAIDTGDSKIILDNHGAPWQTGPIFLTKPNQEIHFANGAQVMAIAGGYQGTRDAMFTVQADNVTLNGYANGTDTTAGTATLQMRKADYQNPPYTPGEWRHTVYVGGFSNVTVQGLTLKDSGGDGICVGRKFSTLGYAHNVTIRDIVSDGNHRQGISIGSAVNLTVTNAVFKNTDGTPPQAGVDLEPDQPYDRLENIRFQNCRFENNTGSNIIIHLKRQFGEQVKDVSIDFIDCVLDGSSQAGIFLAWLLPDGPGGHITFKNCQIRNADNCGILLGAWAAGKLKVTFDNVSVENSALTTGYPIMFQKSVAPLWVSGGVDFINGCTVVDSKTNRSTIIGASNNLLSVGFKDINGSIDVTTASPTAQLLNLGTMLDNVGLVAN